MLVHQARSSAASNLARQPCRFDGLTKTVAVIVVPVGGGLL